MVKYNQYKKDSGSYDCRFCIYNGNYNPCSECSTMEGCDFKPNDRNQDYRIYNIGLNTYVNIYGLYIQNGEVYKANDNNQILHKVGSSHVIERNTRLSTIRGDYIFEGDVVKYRGKEYYVTLERNWKFTLNRIMVIHHENETIDVTEDTIYLSDFVCTKWERM